MAANIDRFKDDLIRLIKLGDSLDSAMVREITGDKEFEKQVRKQIDADKVENYIKNLPNFKLTYEAWYSEALILLRQILPDRVANFIGFYEKPKGRKFADHGN
jgi:hypothetical protein